jgi:hypothetical protein
MIYRCIFYLKHRGSQISKTLVTSHQTAQWRIPGASCDVSGLKKERKKEKKLHTHIILAGT